MESLPKLDRDVYHAEMRVELERVLQEVMDAVDEAPPGRVIRDSEEKARDALDRFRKTAYEKALQLKIDVAEAAFPAPVNTTTGKRHRHKGRQEYSVLTINGRLRLLRTRWHDVQESSFTPADAWLDEAEATISAGVREMACRVNQNASSFLTAADMLARTAHIDLSKESLRKLVEGEGRAVQQAMQQAELTPAWSATECHTEQGTTRVYAGCDGVKVPLVTNAEKQKRRTKVKAKRRRCGHKCQPLPRAKIGADNAYKEFKVGYLYSETKEHRYVGITAGDHEAAGRMLRRMSDQVEMPAAEERVGLIDGAPWIRNQFEVHGLVKALGLDFYHLQENAQKARRGVFGEESEEGQTWLQDLMHTFKHEGYHAAWDGLTAWRGRLRSPLKRAAANHLMQYAAERQEMICYPEFLKQHWQIGSGPTESECKTTTQRVKHRGRRWDSINAEAMMALAALDDSRLWHRRWTTLDPARN